MQKGNDHIPLLSASSVAHMVHMELSSDFIRMIQKSSYYWEGAANLSEACPSRPYSLHTIIRCRECTTGHFMCSLHCAR